MPMKQELWFLSDLPDEQGVLSMLRRRAQDEKAQVRKAALQALEGVVRFEAPDYRRQVSYHCLNQQHLYVL